MKKFTDLVKENNSINPFKYTAKLNISGVVKAENEGAAGELVDKEIDAIVEHLNSFTINDLSDGTYEIVSIDPLDPNEAQDHIDNNKVLESLDSHRMSQLHELATSIVEKIQNDLADLNGAELAFVINKVKSGLDVITSNNDTSTNPNPRDIESGYGTDHLAKQQASLGKILSSVEELQENQSYCIVDLGLNEWNAGYEYVGYKPFNNSEWNYYTFKDTLSPANLGEDIMYTKGEINEMIENGQIAFEG